MIRSSNSLNSHHPSPNSLVLLNRPFTFYTSLPYADVPLQLAIPASTVPASGATLSVPQAPSSRVCARGRKHGVPANPASHRAIPRLIPGPERHGYRQSRPASRGPSHCRCRRSHHSAPESRRLTDYPRLVLYYLVPNHIVLLRT